MGLRKASAYSRQRVRPYTRKSSNAKKAYVKAVPPNKIVKFHMGNQQDYNQGKHKFIVRFLSTEKAQVRDNALESVRMWLNKILDEKVPGEYYLVVKTYPHHILRENKTASGAGADRLSSGMSHSFGSVEGRAAIVLAGKEIFFVACETEQGARIAREALTAIKAKMPCRSRIFTEKIQ
mgnify:CR=1 FL=1